MGCDQNHHIARFGDLLQIPLRNGLYKAKEFHGRGTKIVNMGELFAYPILGDVPMKRLELTEREIEKGALVVDDLLFARRSLVAEGAGRCAIVTEITEPTVFESSIIRARPDPKKVNSRWLFYFFLAPQGRDLMRTILRQMAVSGITGTDLAELSLPLPSLAEQNASAGALALIDDRIDLLRQTNTTLETIAQALFKSWFVDFDPVHAKAEGREPEAMDAATAALFPSDFEESELGPIPNGWVVKPFGTQFDFTMGQSPPGSTYNSDQVGVPFFQGCTDFGDVFPAERIYCSTPTRFARAGDVLMSVRAPVGALNIATFGCSIGRGLCGVRHKSGSTGLTYLSLKACIARIENAAGEGALFRSLSKQQLANLPVLVPNDLVASNFVAIIEPIIDRMVFAAQQASNLSQLRDTLLPRLISGKLRLPEATEAAEAALA